jgi:nitroreductase
MSETNTNRVSVEEALANRRSHRDFHDRAISADQLLQILWAAGGIASHRRMDCERHHPLVRHILLKFMRLSEMWQE